MTIASGMGSQRSQFRRKPTGAVRDRFYRAELPPSRQFSDPLSRANSVRARSSGCRPKTDPRSRADPFLASVARALGRNMAGGLFSGSGVAAVDSPQLTSVGQRRGLLSILMGGWEDAVGFERSVRMV